MSEAETAWNRPFGQSGVPASQRSLFELPADHTMMVLSSRPSWASAAIVWLRTPRRSSGSYWEMIPG